MEHVSYAPINWMCRQSDEERTDKGQRGDRGVQRGAVEAGHAEHKQRNLTGETLLFQWYLAALILGLGGYWIYNKNQVDLAQLYLNPEEKLWHVVKYYQNKNQNKGYKLEKNDIVKFGRVRLRVRDIDYAEKEEPIINQIGSNL